jgi:glutamate-ammonia-ligase adenylyltransferase
MVLAGARMLSGVVAPEFAGRAYARIADTLVGQSLGVVRAAFAREHGRIEGARMAVLGLGRLGAEDLTAASDLDLIVLYDFDAARPESDGARPLHATTYFSRLTQRLVTALTAPTRRGALYEVDLRLRPSGGKSAIATQWRGFLAYHSGEAETWEQMALTRARSLAGDASLTDDAAREIARILRQPRDANAVARDILAMRRLIAAEKGEDDPDDLRNVAGGLTDCEFLAQHLTLVHAGDEAQMVGMSTLDTLRLARDRGWLSGDDAATLGQAYGLMRDVLHLQRLTVRGRFVAADVAPQVKMRIATSVGLPNDAALQAYLADLRQRVRAIFRARLGRA